MGPDGVRGLKGGRMEDQKALWIHLRLHRRLSVLDPFLRKDSQEPVAPGKPGFLPEAFANHRLPRMQHQAYCPLGLAFPLLESVLQMFFFPAWRTPHSGYTARLK